MIPGLRTYPVKPSAREQLIAFMTEALQNVGCKLLHKSAPDRAPFTLVFETAAGERIGIVVYAFLATRTPTKNRPVDERSFQIKYGSKASYADDNAHDLWQDPLGIFTTLLVGIDPAEGICVSADPIAHSPTKFFIRLEFKDDHADAILDKGWFAWQRIKKRTPLDGLRVETLVGVTKDRFLDLVRFERAAKGLDAGNRLILAEGQALRAAAGGNSPAVDESAEFMAIAAEHPLVAKFGLRADEIFDLIASSRRLEMAVRGFVAERHLLDALLKVFGVTHCARLDEEGGPDLEVRYQNGPRLTIECKNVAREVDRLGNFKIDFQRTRASKTNPCSRYYEPQDFDVVGACLFNVSKTWDFRFSLSGILPPHQTCVGRITSNIRVDGSWTDDAGAVFEQAYASKGVSR